MATLILKIEVNVNPEYQDPVSLGEDLVDIANDGGSVYALTFESATWESEEDTRPVRRALVLTSGDSTTVERYLPANYEVEVKDGHVYIVGHDHCGWTLDGYVIPRLASGLIFAQEVSL